MDKTKAKLKVSRSFFFKYPQVVAYLQGKSPTLSDKFITLSTYMLSLPDKKTLQDFLLKEMSK